MKALTLIALAAVAAPAASPADTDSMESLVAAVYSVISGPAGVRDWARFRGLFAEGARLISMRAGASGSTPVVMSPDDYARRAGANFEKTPFFETEVARRTETFGAIGHVFSTYESRRASGEKPFARGINSFQLVKEGVGWKVMTILWDTESEAAPIPERYLK